MNFVLGFVLFFTICFDPISSQDILPSGCQESFRNAALIAHNNLRAKHGALPLQANANIDASALGWSNSMAANGKMVHSDTVSSGLGENLLFFAKGVSSSSQCVDFAMICVNTWYAEKKDYNDNTGFTHETGHFTQLVWKSSSSIGLGMACRGNSCYCTAHYSPPGNVPGQFIENVSNNF